MAGRSQVERCLAVVELLFSHVLDGMSNKALARQLGESEVNICRDLAALEKAGRADAFDARVNAQARQMGR